MSCLCCIGCCASNPKEWYEAGLKCMKEGEKFKWDVMHATTSKEYRNKALESYQKAIKFLTKAATRNHVESEYALGKLYTSEATYLARLDLKVVGPDWRKTKDNYDSPILPEEKLQRTGLTWLEKAKNHNHQAATQLHKQVESNLRRAHSEADSALAESYRRRKEEERLRETDPNLPLLKIQKELENQTQINRNLSAEVSRLTQYVQMRNGVWH